MRQTWALIRDTAQGFFEHDFMRSSCGGDVGRGEGEMEPIGCISEHQARWWKPGQNRSGAEAEADNARASVNYRHSSIGAKVWMCHDVLGRDR